MDEKILKPFTLINVVKYAKGHYLRTNCIWFDLALCLHADGYGPFCRYSEDIKLTPQEECCQSKRNISELILSRLRPYLNSNRIVEITRNASPEECWKVGFDCKGKGTMWDADANKDLPEYDYWEALVRAHLSELVSYTYDELGYENWDMFNLNSVPELKKGS